jgi:hypothetical protein
MTFATDTRFRNLSENCGTVEGGGEDLETRNSAMVSEA